VLLTEGKREKEIEKAGEEGASGGNGEREAGGAINGILHKCPIRTSSSL